MNKKYKKPILLSFRHSVSRGQNTYGYNIVSLYIDGSKVASTCGGGYDMKGTVLGQYIREHYEDRLKKLKGNHGSLDDGTGYYGLTFYDRKNNQRHKTYKKGDNIYLDGACGVSCMVNIAKAIGIDLTYTRIGRNNSGYFLTDNR